MSDGNTPTIRPTPDQPNPDHGALKQIATSLSGATLDAHETDPPGADGQSIRAGHEPDRFQARSVLYVPMLVVGVVIFAFTTVTILFTYLVHSPPVDVNANVAGAADSTNNINQRFAKISSTDPDAPTKQPRLEYLKQVATEGDKDPPYLRSKLPVPAVGATWEIYPEDLRPARFIDPTSQRKMLVESAWLDESKKTAARIPIERAMKLVVANKKLAVRKDPVAVPGTSDGKAKLSNAGRGGPSQPEQPTPAAKPGDKPAGKPTSDAGVKH